MPHVNCGIIALDIDTTSRVENTCGRDPLEAGATLKSNGLFPTLLALRP